MSGQKGVERVVSGLRIVRAAGAEMRCQAGMDRAGKVSKVFALFRVRAGSLDCSENASADILAHKKKSPGSMCIEPGLAFDLIRS